MTLKFKVDENLPTEAASLLNEAGHDALTVGDYPGIVMLRLSRLDKPRVLHVIQSLLPTLKQESPSGKLWIVDETTVRIRD